MKIVVLITCTKNKHLGTHKAEHLYSKSGNFVKYLECAKQLTKREDIYVISALHKLVPLDRRVKCYDFTLKDRQKDEVETWGKDVAMQLNELYDFNNTRFIVIADDDYCTALKPCLPAMDTPLEGFGCSSEGYYQLDAYVKQFVSMMDI